MMFFFDLFSLILIKKMETMFKKTASLILILISYLQANSQGLVGIYNQTISISPNYTISNNTNITVSGQVINTSTTNITGTIHVNIAIDTSSNSTPKYVWRSTMSYPVTNLTPNGTFFFNVNDNASNVNGYKVAGNGTTVVAWPVVGLPNDSLTCSDSAFSNVYILPLIQHIEELDNLLKQIPNPLAQDIQFVNASSWHIDLIDVQGHIVEIQNSKLIIQNFSKGVYFLRIRNENGEVLIKKIIIE